MWVNKLFLLPPPRMLFVDFSELTKASRALSVIDAMIDGGGEALSAVDSVCTSEFHFDS